MKSTPMTRARSEIRNTYKTVNTKPEGKKQPGGEV
jgi:hypothetical protein